MKLTSLGIEKHSLLTVKGKLTPLAANNDACPNEPNGHID
jgi:hypothetical protein